MIMKGGKMTSEGIMNLFSTGTTPTPLVNGSKTDTSKKAVDFSNVFSINVKTSDKGFGNSKPKL